MTAIPLETLVTVFGGSGFLGRHVVRALARSGYRIRVAVRRPELAGHLQPLGRVGQIHAVALAAAANGTRLVHVSAIGADGRSPSHYARSKAAGEQHVLAAVPSAVIV